MAKSANVKDSQILRHFAFSFRKKLPEDIVFRQLIGFAGVCSVCIVRIGVDRKGGQGTDKLFILAIGVNIISCITE